jgi:hypothetical protein
MTGRRYPPARKIARKTADFGRISSHKATLQLGLRPL